MNLIIQHYFMKQHFLSYLIALLLFPLYEMQAAYQPEFSTAGFYELANSGREVYSMNPAWRFHKGTATGAETTDFNDQDWKVVSLPDGIEYVRMAYDSEITDEEIEKILKAFEMDDKQDKLGNELSKGMMQKVSICCALAVKPEVILLDEPMVGLDPAAIKMLKDVVLKLRDNGATVLISTHMLEMVENLWDVMIVMEQGHIAGSYTKADAQGKELDELFFEMTGGEKA